jgi:hypothetical protein
MEESVQIITNSDPNPRVKKTYGSGPEHWIKETLRAKKMWNEEQEVGSNVHEAKRSKRKSGKEANYQQYEKPDKLDGEVRME